MDVKISKSAHQCHACAKPFEHEQRIISSMRRGPEGLAREDVCPECWNDEKANEVFCMWTAQFQDPKVLEQQPEEVFTPLRQIFYESAEREGREAVAVAYLAGQLLRRQKVFRFIKQTADPDTEAVVFLFLDRIGNRLIEVNDPNLSTGELERARQELLQRLAELEGTLDEPETDVESDNDSEEADAHGENESELAQA
jgi:hypothetical protein